MKNIQLWKYNEEKRTSLKKLLFYLFILNLKKTPFQAKSSQVRIYNINKFKF
jgi:hypothetical protein